MPNDLDIPMPHMTPAEASYRARRPRSRVDTDTRRLALLAGGIAAVLLLVVGVWAIAGRHHEAGVPVVQADARPWRTKPAVQPAAADGADDVAGKIDALAPPPEVPAPQTLRQEADKLNAAAAAPIVASTSPTQAAPVAAPAATPAPVAPPAAASHAAAPAAAPVAGGALVQLGALDSEQAAMTEWQRLQHKMPDLLSTRQPAIARSDRDGKTYYRLRTGGFASTASATAFCEQVRQKGIVCTLARS